MFKATRDFTLADGTVLAGTVVEKPTTRMIELGLVVQVSEDAEEATKETKESKKAKGGKAEKVEEKKEEGAPAETPPVAEGEGAEQILTEQSSDVQVEKTDEAQ